VTPPAQQPAFEPLGNGEVVGRTASGVALKVGRTTVEVTALAEDLFRVGVFGDGRPVNYRSEAVAKTDWPASSTTVAEDGTRLTTPATEARISLSPLRVGFHDRQGREIAVDDPLRGAGFV